MSKFNEKNGDEAMNEKKIAIVCHSFRLDGGMGRYVLILTQGLLDLGYQVTVITKKVDRSIPIVNDVECIQIHTKLIPQKLVDHYFNWRLGHICSSRKFDAVISCNRNTHSSIGICGGTHIGYLQAIGKVPRVSDRWQIKLEKGFYKNCKLIIAHSQRMKDELINLYGVSDEKIFVKYPPFSIENFSLPSNQLRASLRAEFKFSSDQVVFVLPSAGNHYVKGFDLIAEYFSRSALPILLVVAGRPIPSGYKNVRYIGFQKNMAKLYQAADFTILPSRYEAFGQVGPESVACGTPVVFSKAVGSSEVISEKAKIVFDWSILNDVDRAIKTAVDLARSGKVRILDPVQYINCQTDIRQHVKDIIDTFSTLEHTKGS